MARRSRFLFFAIPLTVSYVILAGIVRADTPAPGIISRQTWTKANSPYRVTGDIVLPADSVLTIEPGVDVLFEQDARLNVFGRLIAVGTETDSIRFIPATPTGSWYCLRFGGVDSSVIRYARVTTGHNTEEQDYRGGIYIVGPKFVEIDHCDVSGNRSWWGGGIVVDDAEVAITNSTIRNNDCRQRGGGVLLWSDARARIEGCVITGNTAHDGGGVVVGSRDSVEIVNCTIVNNAGELATRGGGLVFISDNASVRNCVIRGNSPADISGGYARISYSNYLSVAQLSTGQTGIFLLAGNVTADPHFVDPDSGDYRLRADSPVIDAGDPSSPLDPDGSRADMGAIPFNHDAPVVVSPVSSPRAFALFANYPNPFNPSTTIRYALPRPSDVRLAVYDIAGRHVRTLVTGSLAAGMHEVEWDGRDSSGRPCASGVYIYRLVTSDGALARRGILLR